MFSVSTTRRSITKRASAMLIAMSIKMGHRTLNGDVREIAIRRANRQQQRIVMQISIVAVIFFSYMSSYYLSYYVFAISSKWSIVFHSFFYSTTHMINPVIYFICNAEMRNQLKEAIRVLWLYATCRGKENADEFAYSCSKSTHGDKDCRTKCSSRAEYTDLCKSSEMTASDRAIASSQPTRPSNKINSTLPTETSPLFSSKSHYKSMAIRRFSTRRDKTSSSLTHLVGTMSPAQSDPLLMRTKACSIRFDEKSNKVVVDVINDDGNHIEIADRGINRKHAFFKKTNDNESNATITSDNLTPKPILRSSQEILKHRTRLLDRLIASLSVDEHQDEGEDSSSDDDIFFSSSSSSSLIQTKPPTQSCSVEFTSSCAPLGHSLMRLSSTMDALPAALTSVSRKAFHMSDIASKHNSDEDSRPLLQSCPTDDDNNTLLLELNRRTPVPECSSIKVDKPPTVAMNDVQGSKDSAEKSALNGKCDKTNRSMQYTQRSSISSTQSPNSVTISEESTNDVVFL